jgi:hypothetical protein
MPICPATPHSAVIPSAVAATAGETPTSIKNRVWCI